MIKAKARLIFIVIAFCISCQKPPESTIILTGTIWREATVMVVPNTESNKLQHDITDHFPDSDQDDLIVFYRNGKYKWDEGTSKASQTTSQVYQSGTWSVSKSPLQLILVTGNAAITTYDILKMTPEELILRLPYKEDPGNYHFELVYQAEH